MEALLMIIIGIIIIAVIANFRKEVRQNMQILNKNMVSLHRDLENLEKKSTSAPPKESLRTAFKPLETSAQKMAVPIKKTPTKPIQKETYKTPVDQTTKSTTSTTKASTTYLPKDKSAKRDYEKLIGENWLNKIGIAILVLGIGFFVRYAIDQNWISETGRVAIGLLCGVTLGGLAHYLRKKYRAFSSVLIGGGISVLYYTITIAFKEYGLFDQTAAFFIMILITLCSTVLAIAYNRVELAIIALLGGFTSPIMVSSGSGDYITFFTYIAILNAGVLLLSYFKKWKSLNTLAFILTTLFFGVWLIFKSNYAINSGGPALTFAAIFFCEFLAMSLLYNMVNKISFNGAEFIRITSITALFFGASIYITNDLHSPVSLGIINNLLVLLFVTLSFISWKKSRKEDGLTQLLFVKALIFIALYPLFYLDVDYITIFWGLEAFAVLLIGLKFNLKTLKNASLFLLIPFFFGHVRNWVQLYLFSDQKLSIIFNPAFITGMLSILILTGILLLLKAYKNANSFLIKSNGYSITVTALIFIISYFTGLLETIHHIQHLNKSAYQLVIWLFHLVPVLGLLIISLKEKKQSSLQLISFFTACLYLGIGLISTPFNHLKILYGVIENQTNSFYYNLHFVLIAGFVSVLLLLKHHSKTVLDSTTQRNWFLAGLSVAAILIATIELDQILGYGFAHRFSLTTVFEHTRKEGYTVLWGVCSLLLIVIGMKKKNQVLRVLALIIFCITLLKLFITDIRDISDAGKIIAFISLGVLLLVVSFMYQKLKQLIVGDDQHIKENN